MEKTLWSIIVNTNEDDPIVQLCRTYTTAKKQLRGWKRSMRESYGIDFYIDNGDYLEGDNGCGINCNIIIMDTQIIEPLYLPKKKLQK